MSNSNITMVISEATAERLFNSRGWVDPATAAKLRQRGVKIAADQRIVGKWSLTYDRLARGWELTCERGGK